MAKASLRCLRYVLPSACVLAVVLSQLLIEGCGGGKEEADVAWIKKEHRRRLDAFQRDLYKLSNSMYQALKKSKRTKFARLLET